MRGLKSTKGMTMVEIIIALAILGLVSVGIMGFFTDSFKFQARSQNLVVAQKEVEAIMEDLKNYNGAYGALDISTYSSNSKIDVEGITTGYDAEIKLGEIKTIDGSDINLIPVTITLTSTKDSTITATLTSTVKINMNPTGSIPVGGGAGGSIPGGTTSYPCACDTDCTNIVNTSGDTCDECETAICACGNCTIHDTCTCSGGGAGDGGDDDEGVVTVILRYERNSNGDSVDNMPSSVSCNKGESVEIDSGVPSRDGYTFAGWNEREDGTGAYYAGGATITLNATISLHAQWNEDENDTEDDIDTENTDKQVRLTYHGNGGWINDLRASAETYTISSSETSIKANLTTAIPTREGYNFVAWKLYTTSDDYEHRAPNPITLSTHKTIYAQWGENMYTIAYDKNQGESGTMGTNISMRYNSGFSLNANSYKRTGYTFAGWNTKADGSGESYTDQQYVTISELANAAGVANENDATITLYAQWQERDFVVRLNYYTDKTCKELIKTDEIEVKTDGAVNFVVSANITKEGHSLYGWTKNGDEIIYINDGYVDDNNVMYSLYYQEDILRVDNVKKDIEIKLYPVWQKYRVLTYDANGGEGAPQPTKSRNVVSTIYEIVPVTASTQTPTRNGYTFMGWAHTKTMDYFPTYTEVGERLSAGGTIKLVGDMTVYAMWKKDITITYYANGGLFEDGSVSCSKTITIVDGVPDRMNYPESPTPVSNGTGFISFAGWEKDGTIVEDYSSLLSTDSHTLRANWNSVSIGSFVKYEPTETKHSIKGVGNLSLNLLVDWAQKFDPSETTVWEVVDMNFTTGQIQITGKSNIDLLLQRDQGYNNGASEIVELCDSYKNDMAESATCLNSYYIDVFSYLDLESPIWLPIMQDGQLVFGYDTGMQLAVGVIGDVKYMYIYEGGEIKIAPVYHVIYGSGSYTNYGYTAYVYPLITIKTDVKITGGTGTSGDPYILSW